MKCVTHHTNNFLILSLIYTNTLPFLEGLMTKGETKYSFLHVFRCSHPEIVVIYFTVNSLSSWRKRWVQIFNMLLDSDIFIICFVTQLSHSRSGKYVVFLLIEKDAYGVIIKILARTNKSTNGNMFIYSMLLIHEIIFPRIHCVSWRLS